MAPDALPDGWGTGEPDDDTLVRAGVASLASRIRHQAAVLGRPVVEDDGWTAAALADRGMFSNAAVVRRPQQDWSWLPEALRGLTPDGVPAIALSPFPTADLSGAGLHLIGHPPFMVRPPGPVDLPPVQGLQVRRIDPGSPALATDLALFERLLIEGYPVPDMDADAAPVLFAPGYPDGDTALYLGYLDGEPVAASAAHVAAGVNQVEFVATLPRARGRGVGTALTAAATLTRPDLPAVLIASDDGRGVYGSLGYLPISRWTLWLST